MAYYESLSWKDCFQTLEIMMLFALKCIQTCDAEFLLSSSMKEPAVIYNKLCETVYAVWHRYGVMNKWLSSTFTEWFVWVQTGIMFP